MPLGPTDPRFEIGGAAVDGFALHDTRQHVVPGTLSAARAERFPGSRNTFVVKGRASRGLRQVTGDLRADTFEDLYTLILQHEALVDSSGVVAVTFHTTTWTSCALVSFETLADRPVGYSDDGGATVKAKIPCRFTFRVLSA